jgi:hypothetical protein
MGAAIPGVMLSLRSILREAHVRLTESVQMRARSFDFAQGGLFGTEVPQDDAG